MSESSPSPAGSTAQNQTTAPPSEYFNYFTTESPYYNARYESYPYHLYGANSSSGGANTPGGSTTNSGASSSYYPSAGGGPTFDTTSNNFAPAASKLSTSDYNYSSYYLAAAAAAQYYPSPPPNCGLNYTATSSYGSNNSSVANSNNNGQTLYHLTDHLPNPSPGLSLGGGVSPPPANAGGLLESPDSSFVLESGKGTSSGGRKSTLNRGRGKPRRNSDSPVITNNINRVFIWDLDETIIIYHSLLTGSYADRYSKDMNRLHHLGQSMENLIFRVADNNFFFNDLEDCDQIHVDDVAGDDNGQDLNTYNFSNDGFRSSVNASDSYMASGTGIRGGVEWMRKLSFRFRKIKESYNLYRNSVGELLGSPKQENWSSIIDELELQTNGWYSIALKCLKLINERSNCVNILVTQTGLVEALTKVLLFRLGPIFQIENLYSASKVGKNTCFDRITQRFGKKNITYVVIGDGEDEEKAAKSLGYPYWRIGEHKDLDALYNALKLDYI